MTQQKLLSGLLVFALATSTLTEASGQNRPINVAVIQQQHDQQQIAKSANEAFKVVLPETEPNTIWEVAQIGSGITALSNTKTGPAREFSFKTTGARGIFPLTLRLARLPSKAPAGRTFQVQIHVN